MRDLETFDCVFTIATLAVTTIGVCVALSAKMTAEQARKAADLSNNIAMQSLRRNAISRMEEGLYRTGNIADPLPQRDINLIIGLRSQIRESRSYFPGQKEWIADYAELLFKYAQKATRYSTEKRKRRAGLTPNDKEAEALRAECCEIYDELLEYEDRIRGLHTTLDLA